MLNRVFVKKSITSFAVVRKLSTETSANEIGQFFHNHILIDGKNDKHLPLTRLSELFAKCNQPEHLSYIKHALSAYQTKGQDFSEDTASHFVRACLRAESSTYAAEIFSKYHFRIGAWVPPKQLGPLIDDLLAKSEGVVCANMLSVLSKKGVIGSIESFEKVLDAVTSAEDANKLRVSLLDAASRMVSSADHQKLVAKYPVEASS